MKKSILNVDQAQKLTKEELKNINGAGCFYVRYFFGFTLETCLAEGGRFRASDSSCSIYSC
jgi:hypothetical protein